MIWDCTQAKFTERACGGFLDFINHLYCIGFLTQNDCLWEQKIIRIKILKYYEKCHFLRESASWHQNLCHEAGSWRTNCAMKLLLGSHEAGSWQLSGAMRQVHGIFLVP